MQILHSPLRQRAWQVVLLALAGTCLRSNVAHAHEGPPFPIMMDRMTAGYRVSVWADPDIGEAYFYVILETPEGQRPQIVPQVSLWTKPISGRLDRVSYAATQQNLKSHLQFEVEPYFDQGDMWDVGIQIQAPSQTAGELVAQVESTPPGYGAWDLALYLFPFVLMGGMWVVAVVRRLHYIPEAETQETSRLGEPNHQQLVPQIAETEIENEWIDRATVD